MKGAKTSSFYGVFGYFPDVKGKRSPQKSAIYDCVAVQAALYEDAPLPGFRSSNGGKPAFYRTLTPSPAASTRHVGACRRRTKAMRQSGVNAKEARSKIDMAAAVAILEQGIAIDRAKDA